MSNIEWTDATWNPVSGCTRVSPGCDHCYAVTMTHRLEGMDMARRRKNELDSELNDPYSRSGKYAGLTVLNGRGDRHFNGVVRCHEDALSIPMRWTKPKMIFVNSMADLFHKDVPFEFIDRVFAVMALCPRHAFQVLTKRPEQMQEYWRDPGRLTMVAQAAALMGFGEESMSIQLPLPNVWLGTSVERQQEADERIPHLMKCPAAVRFLSCEPLLGPVDLSAFFGGPYVGLPGDVVHDNYNFGIDWVIVGGESGPGARPCNIAWIRSIVEQCKAAGVPCFVKQLGAVVHDTGTICRTWPLGLDTLISETDCVGTWRVHLADRKGGDMAEWPEDLRVRETPTATKA